MNEGPHHGMPGPGGSMGTCAVCGENFIECIIRDLIGLKSGIKSASIGFIRGTVYMHAPKCTEAVNKAFEGTSEPQVVHDKLPDGPLKKALAEAIVKGGWVT